MKIIRFFLIILLFLMLSSCSRIKFAYNQLDWLLPVYLESYMSLSEDQSIYLKVQVTTLLVWHCAMQLANYAELFREANADFQKGKMSRARLDYFDEQIESYWLDLMRQLSPIISQLLLDANNMQLEELFKRLEENNSEWQKEIQEQNDTELRDEYQERITEVLEYWFGPLQETQLQVVHEWVGYFQPMGLESIKMRRKWQSRLHVLISHRNNKAAFKAGIDQLLLQPELLRSSSYQKILDDNRKATKDLLYYIGNHLDKSQRKHFAMEALAIAQDFDDLACKQDGTDTSSLLSYIQN